MKTLKKKVMVAGARRPASAFGSALLAARTKLGFTLRDVEERSGMSRQTILRAERGLPISLDLVVTLFDVLKIRGKGSSDLLQVYVKEHIARVKRQRDERPSK